VLEGPYGIYNVIMMATCVRIKYATVAGFFQLKLMTMVEGNGGSLKLDSTIMAKHYSLRVIGEGRPLEAPAEVCPGKPPKPGLKSAIF
jgi:hypothetical protein